MEVWRNYERFDDYEGSYLYVGNRKFVLCKLLILGDLVRVRATRRPRVQLYNCKRGGCISGRSCDTVLSVQHERT